MLDNVFSPWPSFSKDEADAVCRVLLSNKVNYWQGQECREFEKEFASWVDTEYAVALSNGTVALDSALKALCIEPGDEIVVTPRTFIASASCIVNAGATPVFADVDSDSQNITAETISAVLTSRTKAIICVHLAGWPCDMDPIMELAEEKKLFVIEDCAQAHGAFYKNRSVGSIGHIGVWSFCQDKIMTTGGEGGMVTTNDRQLWSRVWSYKDHGKSWEAVYKSKEFDGYRWLHESFGTNGRMTEMQAAIGRFQLSVMNDWHDKRIKNASRIWETAKHLPALRVPEVPGDIIHAAYKCYVFVKAEMLNKDWDRVRIINTIQEEGVPCFWGACSEVYLEKAFEGTGWQPDIRLPTAKGLGESSLMFLVHPTLTAKEIEKTCAVLQAVMGMATKMK